MLEGPSPAIKARGYWATVWRRFKRDRLALVGGVVILIILFAALFGAPLAEAWLGHGPNELFKYGVDQTTLLPVGPWTQVYDEESGEYTLFVLGASDTLGP